MKKILALLLSIVMIFGITGCIGKDLTVEEPAAETPAVEEPAAVEKEVVLADTLRLNIALGNNNRTITYNQATPMTLPDGSVVSQGDLKPTWQYIAKQLGFSLVDAAVQDQSSSEMIDIAAALNFTDATVYGGSGIAEKFMSYGAQGYFLNLNDYLSQLPNFGAYLAENPNIAKAITAYDGGIYHVPYAAELENYARVFNGRETWITALLDQEISALEAETATLTVAYDGYWDRQATNVADLQNAAATGGTLSRDAALETLTTYIKATYPELAKPSDLFIGSGAQYDMDELVALWRVMKLSPNTLSKVSSGNVIEGAVITPFFVRKAEYREDVLRLATYFGGQRVHGSDSYGARFYTDANGDLQFSYNEDGFMAAVEKLNGLFSEGLIFQEFADLSNKDDFRKELYSKDTEEGHQQFGFMTYDWISSTTAANPDVIGILPPLTTVGSDEFIHFMENTRVIKPDGWAISSAATEEEINSALALFDYMFSVEGNVVQNYGPPEILAEGEVFVATDGTEYPKFNQWLFDITAELKDGDVSSFLRDFYGSQIPIGYQKEIGFELQNTINRGWDAWDLYKGNDVLMTSYEAENPLFRLVPPVFSMTEQDLAKLGTIAISEDQVDQIFLYMTGAKGAATTTDELKKNYADSGIDQYIEVYRTAYARMIAE